MHEVPPRSPAPASWRLWAGRHRVICAVLALVSALLSAVPALFLSTSLSLTNFPGYGSPLFIVPVVMLGIFALSFLFFLVAFIFGRRH